MVKPNQTPTKIRSKYNQNAIDKHINIKRFNLEMEFFGKKTSELESSHLIANDQPFMTIYEGAYEKMKTDKYLLK